MPICRRSGNSALVATSALLFGGASVAFGQATPAVPMTAPASPDARARAAAEGDKAMEQLKRAIAGQKTRVTARPALPNAPPPDLRRRAFDAVRRRAPAPAMDARARTAVEAGRAALAAQREAMANRLGQALGLEEPDMKAVAQAAAPKSVHAWVPLLFVSSSMPVPTLRAYAAQLERVGGVLAFRGMPGGLTKVAPMAKLSAEILRIDPGCEGPACPMRNVQLIVDPIVFRQHDISRVPALAMVPGDPTQPYCERDEDSPPKIHKIASVIVFGDAALSGLLEEYARLGGREEVRDAQARLGAR